MTDPRAALRVRVRRYAALAVVNVVVLVVLLVAAEAAFRLFFPGRNFYARTFAGQHQNRTNWARVDADLGWVFSGSGYQTFTRPEKQWTASVNREGFRSTFNYGDRGAKGSVTRVMVLGDSYVFGVFLNDPDTFCVQLQDQLGAGYEVYNFGIPGWGVDQMYLAYLKYVDVVQPDIVMAVYIDDDVTRVFEAYRTVEGLNKPSFTLEHGRLVPRSNDHPGPADWLAAHSLMASQVYNVAYRIPTSAAITRALFAELADATKQRGQRFVVVRYPGKREIVLDARPTPFELIDVFKERNVPYFEPAADMRATGASTAASFYFSDDAHPTRAGNAFVTRYLVTHGLTSR